jgi:hypothetical protein
MQEGVLLILFYACAVLSAGAADLTTITFDESPQRTLDGTNIKGVTFQFQGSSAGMPVAQFGGTKMAFGETKLMSSPWLEGAASGTLTMKFTQPTPYLSFSVGLAGGGPLTPGYMVGLFSGEVPIGSTPVSTQMGGSGPFAFTEGAFTYNDPTRPLSSVVVTMAPPLTAEIFVLDNVTIVPEPSSFELITIGIGSLIVTTRLKQKAARASEAERLFTCSLL